MSKVASPLPGNEASETPLLTASEVKERGWAHWNQRMAELESEMFRAMLALSTSTRPRKICFRGSDHVLEISAELGVTKHAAAWLQQLQASLTCRLLLPSANTAAADERSSVAPTSAPDTTATRTPIETPPMAGSLLALPCALLDMIIWEQSLPAASIVCAATCKLLGHLLMHRIGPFRLSVLAPPSTGPFTWPTRWCTWQSSFEVLAADWKVYSADRSPDLTDPAQLDDFFGTWFSCDRFEAAPGVFTTTLRRYWDACAALPTHHCVRRRCQLRLLVGEFDRLQQLALSLIDASGAGDNESLWGYDVWLWLSVIVYLAPSLSEHGPLSSDPGVLIAAGRVTGRDYIEAYCGDHEGFGHEEVILVLRLESGDVLAVQLPPIRCGMYGCCDHCIAPSNPQPVKWSTASSFQELCRGEALSQLSVQWVPGDAE